MRGEWKLTTAVRGKVAELYFQAAVLGLGWEVATPVVEDSEWDALFCKSAGCKWLKAQIKRVYYKGGHPTVNLVRSDGSKYDDDSLDYLAAVDFEDGSIYLVPRAAVAGVTRKRLNPKLREEYRMEVRHADHVPF